MKSTVYFLKKGEDDENHSGIFEIIEKSSFYDRLSHEDSVGLKIHCRDMFESDYVNLEVLNRISDSIKNQGADSFLICDDSLYHQVTESKSIKELFDENDNVLSTDYAIESVNVEYDDENQKHIPVLKSVRDCDSMIIFSHFKGHSMTAFSGAVKNTANCTDKEGKKMMHRKLQPFISRIACLACNECVKVCRENAITLDSYAVIDKQKCTGCNACISSCPKKAIKINRMNSKEFMEDISKFASGVLKDKKDNKVLFINILINIKPYYDFNLNSDEVLVNDIGLLASYDPVAIDKASYDMVNANQDEDIFRQKWRNIDGRHIFEYAEELNLGSGDYELIEL